MRRFLILLVAVTELLLSANSKTYWEDVEVLKQLKSGLDPNSVTPGSCLSSWDFAYDPCDSLFSERFTCGFTCDASVSGASRLTEITLDQAGYAGPLLATVATWNLPYLETLDLSNNFLNGSVPDSLSNLNRLRRLGLSSNSFSGEVPPSIGAMSSLEELLLDNNRFHGAVPASLSRLSNLRRLEIQKNNLSGVFPDLRASKSLSYIDASDNSISGEVPASFPATVVEISMRNNNLRGSVPNGVKSLTLLQVMDLSLNNLSGAVPSFLFTHPSLQQLTLAGNRFSSVQSPSADAGRSELVAVDFSGNQLRGFLPAFMAEIPRLSVLSLENNRFSGMVPIQYAFKAAGSGIGGGVAAFSRLLLSGNYLLGPLPSPLMQLKPGQAAVSLGDNCLYSCPTTFFFCQGGEQKALAVCRSFGPAIPPTR